MENKLGSVRCRADNCLLMREGELVLVVVCVYIDDTISQKNCWITMVYVKHEPLLL